MRPGTEKGQLTAVDFDLRVRERHLASGVLNQPTIERHLAELPDLEGHAETIPFEQPALGRSGADGGP